jgi:hypothetical protein
MTQEKAESPYPWKHNGRKEVDMMTTEQHAWATSQIGSRHEVRTTRPVCGCGQDLDVCTSSNCPRCGTSLLAYAA